MKQAVAFARALADSTRWRIALLVSEQTLCVCELEDALRLPQSTLSSHLTVMRSGGLLEVERRGKWAYYSLSPELRPVFEALRTHFAGSLRNDPVVAADGKRTARRVALRGRTNCRAARRMAIPPATASAAGCCP